MCEFVHVRARVRACVRVVCEWESLCVQHSSWRGLTLEGIQAGICLVLSGSSRRGDHFWVLFCSGRLGEHGVCLWVCLHPGDHSVNMVRSSVG